MILNFPGALLAATFLFALGCSSNDEPTSPSPVDEPVAQSSPETPETAELAATSPKSESATVPEESATTTAKQWKDTAGNVLAVGQFVSLMDDKVCIETPEGLGTVVPLVNLCAADRKLVQAEPEADLTAEPEPEVAVEEMVEEIVTTPSRTDDDDQSQKVVIPFDFVSKFDDGRYGRNIGDMIVKKIQKQGTFAVPDAIDIRDLCAAQGVKITPETPLKEIQRVLRDLFDAQIAIWGSCERAPGQEWEIYDVTLKCADFSNNQQPKVLYEKSVRTKSVSEIPHRYVAEMLDKLYGREPGAPEPLDPVAEKNWIDNPNLVENGTFEAGARGVPIGWEDRGGQFREPLGKLVQWIPEAGNPENHVIRFTFDAGVGDGYGVMYYSRPFPIEEAAKYRFQCRFRTNGPAVKIFIKCYDQMPSDYKPTDLAKPPPHPTSQAGGAEYVPEFGHLRECYRSQQNLKGATNKWHTHTQGFTPKHTKYTPQWGRVMLYAYLGAGVVEFDDIVIKQIVPASASDRKKERRHSQDSTVTIKEMEENERRARQNPTP